MGNYSTRSFLLARSFTSSKSKGSVLTCATSLVAREGVESRILNASLTADVSTATRRLVAPVGVGVPIGPAETGFGASGDRRGAETMPTPIDVARGVGEGEAVAVAVIGAGVGGAGVSSIVGPVHFVRPATTSASKASEANFAFG